MKKVCAWMLCMLLLLTAAGSLSLAAAEPVAATPTASPATAKAAATPTPTNAVATPTPLPDGVEAEAQAAAHQPEYGETLCLEADQGGFSATIAIPAGFEALDDDLQKWANTTLKLYEKKAGAEKPDADGMTASLNVSYDSYVLGDRFIGVEEFGVYEASDSKTTEPVLYTVNYDSSNETLLTIQDVIDKDQIEKVNALIVAQLTEAKKQDFIVKGRDLTEHFIMTGTGVAFVLTHDGAFYQCTLPYETLQPYLVLGSADDASASAAAPVPTSKPNIVEEGVCTHNGAHIRSEAKIKSNTLAVVQAGAILEVVEPDAGNGFTQIWYQDAPAYIRTSFLSLDTAVVAAVEDPSLLEKGYATANGVHVRAQAGTRAKKLGTLSEGDEVAIITEYYTDGWHRILYRDQAAYVSAQYISIGSRPAVTPPPQKTDPENVCTEPYIEFVGTCTTNGVIVRSETSIHSDYYAKLYAGEEVCVVESEYRSGWDKVWIPYHGAYGCIGYVHSRYIEDASAVVPVVQATDNPVVPVVQATPAPVIPVIQATRVPVITSNPVPVQPGIGSGATFEGSLIGQGATVNP